MGLNSFIQSRATADEDNLARLGYKQELKRQLSSFHNYAVAFSYMSPITGLTGTYGMLYAYGGPVTIMYTWILVCAFNVVVGLSMAEICSAYPTSGGVYFYAYKLGGERSRRLACWITGWFNMLGQIACSAGVAYTIALLVADFVLLATGTAAGGGRIFSQKMLLIIYAGVLVLIGIINTVAVRSLGVVSSASFLWQVVLAIIFVIILAAVAPIHQSASWVFTEFIPDPATGVHNSGFLFLLGILGSQWSVVGYDCAAHMVEETKGADFSGPVSIIGSIVTSFIVGFIFLIGLTFSITDPSTLGNLEICNNAVMQVTWEAFKGRYGSGTGGLILMIIPLLCVLFCGNACVTANSRMVFAFARDNAIPGSALWKKVHPYFEAPINAVWLCVFLCFVLFLPSLGNTVAFTAITSVGVIGLYISYAIPIGLRVFYQGDNFQTGPFNLGRWSKPIGVVAFTYLIFACAIFVCPFLYPVTAQNLNYAPVAVGVVLVFSLGWWLIDARRWFIGPLSNLDPGVELVKATEEY